MVGRPVVTQAVAVHPVPIRHPQNGERARGGESTGYREQEQRMSWSDTESSRTNEYPAAARGPRNGRRAARKPQFTIR